MGLIAKLFAYMDREPANKTLTRDPFAKGRGNMIRKTCKVCGGGKAFIKDGNIKCTKCGARDVL